MKTKSLKLKLSLTIVATALIPLLLLGVVVAYRTAGNIRSLVSNQLQTQMQQMLLVFSRLPIFMVI